MNTAIINGPIPSTNCLYRSIIVKENLPLSSQLIYPNTKYIVKHNFDLNLESILLPPNCIIAVDGGLLSNGILIGNDSILIDVNRTGEILNNVLRHGTWKEADSLTSISIGTVTSGSEPEVTITGNKANPILNFVFPKGDKGDIGNGIQLILLNSDYTLTVTYTNGTTYTTSSIRGEQGIQGEQGEQGISVSSFLLTEERTTDILYNIVFSNGNTQSISIPKGATGPTGETGPTGNGVLNITLNGDYTLTINYTNGTSYTTSSIRGAQGEQGILGIQGPPGDVAVITPEQQSAFTMYSIPGQNDNGPMTLKAVTNNFPGIDNSWNDANLDISDDIGNVLVRFLGGHVITKNFNSSDLKTFIDNEIDTDLDFSDENDNVLMRIADGHIKTKNFDSKNINIDSTILNFVKNKYKGLRCAIVGDSISSYVGTSPSGYQERYPDGDVTNVSQMWWKIVCDTLEMIPVNCSWRGSRVSGAPKGNAYAACSDARVTDIGRNGDPDVVIFFIGCNDWGSNTEPTAVYGTWSVDDPIVDDSSYTSTQRVDDIGAAYALMLSKTQKAYPHAKLFCCTITDEYLRDFDGNEKQDPPQYPPINKRGVSNFTWNQKLKDVMEALGATCINIHDCGINFFNLVNYVTDDTGTQGTALHPNKAGMKLIANKVISALLAG